jgi:hypothetical protein
MTTTMMMMMLMLMLMPMLMLTLTPTMAGIVVGVVQAHQGVGHRGLRQGGTAGAGQEP